MMDYTDIVRNPVMGPLWYKVLGQVSWSSLIVHIWKNRTVEMVCLHGAGTTSMMRPFHIFEPDRMTDYELLQ